MKDITNKQQAPAYQKNKMSSLFEEAGSTKEPVDKADLNDVGNAQAMIPYLADIQRHYREAEVRHRHRSGSTQLRTVARLMLRRTTALQLVECLRDGKRAAHAERIQAQARKPASVPANERALEANLPAARHRAPFAPSALSFDALR